MAVRFDAATDRVSYTASNPPDPATAFTVTMWVYLSVDRNDFSTLGRWHASSGGSTRLTLATGSSGETPCIFSPGNTSGVVAAETLTVGQWSRVAVTASGTSGTIYLADTNTGPTTSSTGTVSGGSAPDGLTLGGRAPSDSSEWFNGRLAYVRLWSAVLSQAEIEAEWASTTPVRTANLWAHWPLATHTDLTDHSGNGRNLVAGSTATTTEDGPPLGSTIQGTAVANLGGLTAVATGRRSVLGVTTGAFGALTATAAGVRAVFGTAAAVLGGLSGQANAAGVFAPTAGPPVVRQFYTAGPPVLATTYTADPPVVI